MDKCAVLNKSVFALLFGILEQTASQVLSSYSNSKIWNLFCFGKTLFCLIKMAKFIFPNLQKNAKSFCRPVKNLTKRRKISFIKVIRIFQFLTKQRNKRCQVNYFFFCKVQTAILNLPKFFSLSSILENMIQKNKDHKMCKK